MATPFGETPPPPAPSALVDAAAPLKFRGRIFFPDGGYTPRSLLELGIREGIGAILNKPQWWVKWRRDDGAIRGKWLNEIEQGLVTHTADSSTSDWSVYALDDAVLARYDEPFAANGSDEEKRTFVDTTCSRVEYNLIWNEEWWETYGRGSDDDDIPQAAPVETLEVFQQGNERMESYGQITWYFELVLLNKSFRETPLENWPWLMTTGVFELGSPQAVAKAREFLLAVRTGTVTKQNFATFCPEGDLRVEIVDALWVHVDRIMDELDQIRLCITKTLDKVIENNKLDAGDEVEEFISYGPVQETWMSDLMIHEELKTKFTKEVAVLENVPDHEKDWHPESNNQVLDLVHPSLLCCVFGVTKGASEAATPAVLPASSDGIVERMQRMAFGGTDFIKNDYRGGAKYQWIPTNFTVDANGKVQILSYINNLHPVKHSGMYDSIASIFTEFVPMFDRVLSCLLNSDGPQPFMEIPDMWSRSTNEIPKHPAIPEILRLQPPATPFTLKGRTVQVIVKIAEIHLTPENPRYPGGAWHVEGSDAEQIVATGIYYFGCENITESKLSFRVIVSEPEYQQDDTVGVAAMYGLARDERLVQNLGAVMAVENRCVVFPNTLQHRVDPFDLADRTKPGVRKILAFFIVDPSKNIPSTLTIPPQQEDWVRGPQDATLAQLHNMADVVLDNVKQLVGTGMTLDEAKQHRIKLMEERKPTDGDGDEDYELFFSLCEH